MPEIAISTSIQRSFTCRKSATRDPRLYFPSEGRRTEEFFFALKNPDGFGRVLNPRNWVLKGSTLPLDHRSRFQELINVWTMPATMLKKSYVLAVHSECRFCKLKVLYMFKTFVCVFTFRTRLIIHCIRKYSCDRNSSFCMDCNWQLGFELRACRLRSLINFRLVIGLDVFDFWI